MQFIGPREGPFSWKAEAPHGSKQRLHVGKKTLAPLAQS
nr:MAG TPA: hypothetical protein [Caudoviricetes sp.]